MTTRYDPSLDFAPTGVFNKLLILVGIIGAAVAILAVIVAVRGGGSAAAAMPEAEQVQTGHLTLTEFAIEGDLGMRPGPTRLEVHNDGGVVHNLVLEGGSGTPDLNGGDSAVLDVGDLEEGTYVVFCDIAGHREAGMTTTAATTTTEPPSTGLPNDACDQLDIPAIQDALGVASMRAGSPFSTSEDGALATCRFAITVSGNLGSSFNITMRAPSESGAFEDALDTLSVGEPTTEITGLGERAHVYENPSGGLLILVEYENMAAASASAGSESAYVNSPADLILMGIMDTVVGPVIRALP